MSVYRIKTDLITAEIDSHGAELVSVKRNDQGNEYIWSGDPKYWKRHSPVLFPLVGRYKNNTSNYNGVEYSMSQHGFARDKEFQLLRQDTSEIWFVLVSDEDTLHKYPFKFELQCGYQVMGNQIQVIWRVFNKDNAAMYFSIGAHPAFAPPINESNLTHCSFRFDKEKSITYSLLNERGLLLDSKYTHSLDEKNCLAIDEHMFDKDALIIENHQAQQVSILDRNQMPYVTVNFEAPLFGLWSPVNSNVPFVCIEPWYGRSDRSDFCGNLQDREWQNKLEPGKEFIAQYAIVFY